MMNKLGILGIVIAIAFVAGIISVNPGAEGVSGWQAAVIEIDEFLDQEEISQLFEFDLVSVEDQDSSCADGEVVKFDSDPLSPTGWSCQDDDDTGDEGPFDSIQFNPLDTEPETCSAETVGTTYYRDVSDPSTPDSLCVCADLLGDGTYHYWDLILGTNTCASP